MCTIRLRKSGLLHTQLKYARTCRRNETKIINFKLTKEFCEFYGILMGDGCLTRYNTPDGTKYAIIISGNKRFEFPYYAYIQNIIASQFKVYSVINEQRNTNAIDLYIRNKSLFFSLHNFGFPIGRKYEQLKIPNQILSLPWHLKKYFIRGLFDTDGTIYTKKHEKYRYPYIGVTSINRELLEEIRIMLRRRGYPFYISGQNLLMRGISNTHRWMQDVGTSQPKHLFKCQYWCKNGNLPANLLGQ